MELGELTPDRLSINGNATLDGTLKIDLANDFSPAINDSFEGIDLLDLQIESDRLRLVTR